MGVKVSVIVPCYNVAPWLERGMQSLVNQSLRDIEIICIDDKSTDNTLDILRSWEKKDTRIRVVANRKNRGVAVSRNIGIDKATGEYVGFMDPDDYVSLDYYEKLTAAADREKTQVACSDILVIDEDGTKTLNAWRPKSELKKSLHNFSYHYTAVYRRDFLNAYNIRYPDLVICEDTIFEALVKCAMTTPMSLVPKIRYFYCRRENSIYGEIFSEIKVRHQAFGLGKIVDLYNSSPVSRQDYIYGAHKAFLDMYRVTMVRNVRMRPFVAQAMCDVFKRLKFPEEIKEKNMPLYTALVNNDPNGVLEVFNGQRWHSYIYKLFGCIKFMTVSYCATQRVVRIFGIMIYHSHTGITG